MRILDERHAETAEEQSLVLEPQRSSDGTIHSSYLGPLISSRDSELVLLETSCPSLPFQGSRQSYLYLSTHYCRQGCCIIYQIIASLRDVSVLRIPAVTTTLDTMSVYKSKTLIIFLPFITLGV